MSRNYTINYHNGCRSSTYFNVLKAMLKVCSYIFLYWCCSISLTFFNRHLFRNYKFPISITTLHMAIKFIFAALIRWFLHRFHYRSCCITLCRQHQNNDAERVNLSWAIIWRKIVPTGTHKLFLIFVEWYLMN